ncbi:DUF6009 family protein [Streptomyces sp. NPDC087440]|jgi:hypothetical protein|uniref:Transcription factor n=2 Tax=Streptomyces TaxID=1883 RepID=A0A918WWM1_9ACTN|nr:MULTISPECIES: DUF6009 family protein [Streptomyces]MCX5206512.1 DUF6009 family protein [Streptomyces sp. NBC_00237]GHA07375.1 hypothetical protein GCM10010329_32630 [Streptomyces spiroverticillatus]GHC90771.1 hypothetical protein GCM10010334_25040 [Streptomyces finlayi]
MSSLLNESDLAHENAVVWLESPDDLDYVRQALDKTPRRRGKPRYARDGRLVGYTELDEHAEADPDSGLHKRRVFFLLPHDRDTAPGGYYAEGAPGEAVDPRTIDPQKVGEKTPRSQQGASAAAIAMP